MAGHGKGDRLVALRGVSRAQTTGSRRSIRLKDYDYATPAAYFVTICTTRRQPIFHRSGLARLVCEAWTWLPSRFPTVVPDEFVVMPDHVHFVIWLQDLANACGVQGDQMVAPTLGRIVGTFKTVAAKAINGARGTRGRSVWQRSYCDHIIGNNRQLERIRAYIQSNPHVPHSHETEGELKTAWL